MGDLAQGVDARVRAPGGEYLGPFAGEGMDGILHGFLHAQTVVLALPADETAPIVLKF